VLVFAITIFAYGDCPRFFQCNSPTWLEVVHSDPSLRDPALNRQNCFYAPALQVINRFDKPLDDGGESEAGNNI
jgi:hypothetical protein